MDQDMSGNRYCQKCSELQWCKNIYYGVCRKCGAHDMFGEKPKPHVGIITGFYLTDADKDFLKTNRIAFDDRKESL